MDRPFNSPATPADLRGPDRASPSLEPGLYVVATPIGNLRDITLRALDVLGAVDLILAEDTRVTRTLLSAYGVEKRCLAFHDHNEDAARPEVLALLADGKAVALVSDAGTPLVSDPGYKLVRAVLGAGMRVFPIPGASAVMAALVASGMTTDRFLFAGFAPAKAAARETFLREFAAVPATLLFYESGPRLKASLEAMAHVFGDREAAICRELTKFYEEVRRGRLQELAAGIDTPPKGEIVVLVAATPRDRPPPTDETFEAALQKALESHSLRDAAVFVAEELGVSRREAYARALKLRDKT